jgi:hypothetical protein
MTNEQLIADAKEAGFKVDEEGEPFVYFNEQWIDVTNVLTAFADIIRKRHEHIRTDNGAVIVKLQADLDKANAEIARLRSLLETKMPTMTTFGMTICSWCGADRQKEKCKAKGACIYLSPHSLAQGEEK